MKELDYGAGYQYPHDYPQNFVQQHYLPDALQGRIFYAPGGNPKEDQFRELLKSRWKGRYNY